MSAESPSPRLAAIAAELRELEEHRSRLLAEQAELTRRESDTLPLTGPQSISTPLTPDQKIALFLSLFACRTDVYPRRWENTKTARKGYSPACRNEWVRGICEKPRVKCTACPHQAFPPLDADAVRDHLTGRHTIGTYAIRADDTCIFLAADFDGPGWRDDLTAYLRASSNLGLTIAAERSRPGRFILTGSANVLLLPRLADSLAGRMEVLRLAPLTQVEIARATPGPGFLERLFNANFPVSSTLTPRLGDELIERVTTGGLPPALARTTPRRRRDWHLAYADALTQRDIRDLANIRSLDTIPRLLELAATQTSHLFNANALSAPLELSRPTVREYLALLEKLFLIELLPPWHHNRLNRLVKTPKLHLADTGLAAALLGLDAAALKADRSAFGRLLESFVCQELRRMATWAEDSHRFFHYRDKDQVEVDVIVERDGRDLCGIEVKASSTVTSADFTGLRRLQAICGPRFKCGVVFYDGETALPFGANLYAVPYPALWTT